MTGYANVGPLGSDSNRPLIDKGTRVCTSAPLAGPVSGMSGQQEFDWQYEQLAGSLLNIGSHATHEARVRAMYQKELLRYRDQTYAKVRAGAMSWRDAAKEASELRNTTLDLVRGRSTAAGLKIAEALKKEGPTFDALIASKTEGLFGQGAQFDKLSESRKVDVFKEIIESAARPNKRVDKWTRVAGGAGRSLVLITLGILIYDIYLAEDKQRAILHGGSVAGGAFAGGRIGGIAAAAVCISTGWFCAFVVILAGVVAGAGAGYGVDRLWETE